jgi:hypothetical protein
MRARALALTAASFLLAKCMPSGDLASYSSGADSELPGGEPSSERPGESTAGGTGGGPGGVTGSGGTEGGVVPGGVQGGDGDSGSGGGSTSVGPETDPDEPGPEEPSTVPEVPQFRFVRLVADSDVSAGPLTSVAELNVLDAEGEPIERSEWDITADSEELVYVGGAQAQYAIDGVIATMWHTPWFEVEPPPHPHFLEIDMGQAHSIGGFRYLPRQDGSLDGSIAGYRFFVSSDGVEWGEPVASGTFPSSAVEQEVRLAP